MRHPPSPCGLWRTGGLAAKDRGAPKAANETAPMAANGWAIGIRRGGLAFTSRGPQTRLTRPARSATIYLQSHRRGFDMLTNTPIFNDAQRIAKECKQ
jgi:hypothetical protein